MITNKETHDTLDLCIKDLREEQSANKRIYQFKNGNDGYYAILGTPNAYGTLYLLKQHPSVFGKKEITRIDVDMSDDKPNMILHIGEREQTGRSLCLTWFRVLQSRVSRISNGL